MIVFLWARVMLEDSRVGGEKQVRDLTRNNGQARRIDLETATIIYEHYSCAFRLLVF